ncbi:hypothetical protein [Leptospira sp. GIMC2001]|uniref:hypothetical protein n=1 Tax=Leptospira sp. GIMC2001 TaxID=1513297 RepID=UPI00234BAA6A|nr:hypothetical protein [Leptospira sp. GIMC2001]WCL48605.1 hypothetical protein O4O04_15020 [Leptospira sp. GIMC2001]
MNNLEISSIFIGAYSMLAFVDGVYFHLWKYRLYAFEQSLYEHKLHTVRALLFPIMIFGLYLYDIRGIAFIIIFGLVIADLIVQFIDIWEERNARKNLGGLEPMEYLVHCILITLHTIALSFYVVSKDFSAWSLTSSPIVIQSGIVYFIATNLLPGAIVIAITHLALILPSFRSNEANDFWFPEILNKICCFPKRAQ